MPGHLGCRRCRPYLICAKRKSTSEETIYKIGPPIPTHPFSQLDQTKISRSKKCKIAGQVREEDGWSGLKKRKEKKRKGKR
jgi:hypothetical protein